ncbi:glutamate racemase [Marinobacter similis]|uniref:glutamate racemase n=1 Tax=Marinobacter similis TaxID=1420916 RepID=UPI000A85FB0E|nr:glutamate racemase [Marinobacter similis]
MTTVSKARVLVFDSGVGGLSVAACVRQHLPGTELLYLADNAGFPYGDQPESVVVERCCRLIGKAIEQYSTDVIVVACNTASTVVLPHLRAMTATPVVGVVPAIKPAAAKTENRRIGVLATPATVRRPYLDQLVSEFASHCQVERIGHPDLVRWVEESVSGVEVSRAALSSAVARFREAGVDTVVLGCTHYPLLLSALREVLPEVRFWLIRVRPLPAESVTCYQNRANTAVRPKRGLPMAPRYVRLSFPGPLRQAWPNSWPG